MGLKWDGIEMGSKWDRVIETPRSRDVAVFDGTMRVLVAYLAACSVVFSVVKKQKKQKKKQKRKNICRKI